MDRQHPRDLFDVKLLLENEGLTEELRKTFIIFLISRHRPMHELLAPNPKDIRKAYATEFAAMAQIEVPVEQLEAAREQLVSLINKSLTQEEKGFLLSFKNKQPNWNLLGIPNANDAARLPSVNWKMINLEKLGKDKHRILYQKLSAVLLGTK